VTFLTLSKQERSWLNVVRANIVARRWKRWSIDTVPVKKSDGPYAVGCDPRRMISSGGLALPIFDAGRIGSKNHGERRYDLPAGAKRIVMPSSVTAARGIDAWASIRSPSAEQLALARGMVSSGVRSDGGALFDHLVGAGDQGR
jgi:hypothetical protein